MHLLLDIEGTITDRSGSGTGADLIRALALIEEKGIPTILCSGRDLNYMIDLRRRWALGPLQGAIAENGCVIAPYPDGVKGASPDPNASRMDRGSILKRLEILHGIVELDPFKEFIISIYVPGFMDGRSYLPEQIDEIHSLVKDSLEGMDCQIVPTSASVEIIPTGVDKGTGIKRYCQLSGIDISDVIFLCDSYNDITGATVVYIEGGKLGVVGKGESSLKQYADRISEKNYWNGALDLLESFELL